MTITVITVNYNNREGLLRTINSALAQTYRNVEYIVVDGGSTDGSAEVVNHHADKLAWWCSEPDGSIYNAMNKGLAHATGEYVLFLNSGDCFADAHALERLLRSHKQEAADLIVARHGFTDNRKVSPRLRSEELDIQYFVSNILPHQATLIRTSQLRECGGYDENYRVVADWVFWVEAVVRRRCKVETVDVVLSLMEPTGASSDMECCHEEMSRCLAAYMDEGLFTWDDVFALSGKARQYTLATRTRVGRCMMRVLCWMGKRR